MSDRVEIPAYTDRWMMGDRLGRIVKTSRNKDGVEIAHVKLSVSGKTVRVVHDHCTFR